MKNKILALAVTTMLLTSMLIISIPIMPTSASPAEIHVPGDYSTIQYAVGNASSGDTIIVAAGTYAGAIVDKNVTIIGASGGASVITSGVPYKVGSSLSTAFRLEATADGVEIRDFTINCNSAANFYFAVFSRNADNVTVDSLVVNDAVQGISNWGGSNWQITNNVLIDTEAAGGGGIAIWLGALPPSYPVCSGNLIENNTITATATAPDYTCPGIGLGVDLRYGTYDYLTGNEDMSNNRILNNNITAPGALNGVGIEMGVLGLEGNATKIAATLGIIHDNTIQGNNIEGADMGIYFYTVADLTIQQNEIKNCNEGIHIKDGSDGNIINYNNILGNTMGLNNTAEELIDARYNYWGHSSGPGPVGPGEGDNVGGNVDFEPWLSCYTPYTTTILYIDPPVIDKLALEECTTFEMEVVIANVTDLYGFDLKLTWNDTLLDLKAVEYETNLDLIWTDWDDAMNETGAGWYRFIAHERTVENGFTGDATLINLTFHVKYGPCYLEEDYQLSTLIHFALVKLSDSNSAPICTKVQDAKYTVYAVKPELEIRPGEIIISKSHETITIEIWLLKAMKVYDYAFNITYDTEILDAVHVEWGDFLPGPYYHHYWHINETNGVIEISLAETAEAPPANGDGLLITITFHHEIIVWKDCPEWDNLLNCTIDFDWWKLSVRCPELREITGNLIAINNAEYSYIPIQGDVNSDGEVDIFDLRIVAAYYDQSQPEKCDLNCDGTIDIFDLVYVATNFGFSGDC